MHIKNELASQEIPDSLEAQIDITICIYSCMRKRGLGRELSLLVPFLFPCPLISHHRVNLSATNLVHRGLQASRAHAGGEGSPLPVTTLTVLSWGSLLLSWAEWPFCLFLLRKGKAVVGWMMLVGQAQYPQWGHSHCGSIHGLRGRLQFFFYFQWAKQSSISHSSLMCPFKAWAGWSSGLYCYPLNHLSLMAAGKIWPQKHNTKKS